MKIEKHELIAVLSQFNPWWRGEHTTELPSWKRSAFHELLQWVDEPPAPRAILLSGARQIGKTTLLLQVIEALLNKNISPANILYATFDHPLLKMAGIDLVLEAWRERQPKGPGIEYLFLDEAQFIPHWGTWVKHQVDFFKNRRITFTGSATPLIQTEPESGLGRWHNIQLATLSFYEYLQLIKQIEERKKLREKEYFNFMFREKPIDLYPTLSLPTLPHIKSIAELFDWSKDKFYEVTELAAAYEGYFHQYLIRGGFPQTAQVDSVKQAQTLLREDIVDRALKRDMTALFGVRRIFELEQTFLYLCMHNGGLLSITNIAENLPGANKPTIQKFIDLLEATHLIYRIHPFGDGKQILRSKCKVYLADAAIAPAVLLKGESLLTDPIALGHAIEATVFKHLHVYYSSQHIRLTYFHGRKKDEIDIIAEENGEIIPYEIKYRYQHTGLRELKGLIELCNKRSIQRAYVITKSLDDFGLLINEKNPNLHIMRIPAALFCYWLGALELCASS